MLTALLLAATTGLSVPSLIDGIGPNDYPTWAIKDEVSGGGVIHAVIDPSGRIAECAVISEIGNSKLAKSLCSILARKRYRPATLRDGRKVHGILDSMVNLWLPDTDEGRKIGAMRQGADAELAVSQLPASEQSDVTVLLAYDAKGKIADCAPVREAKSPTLAKLACDHGAIFDNVVQRDKSGHAVPYVTRKTIRLILSTPQK